MNRLYFDERQRFNQSWLVAVMIITSLAALVPLSLVLYTQLVLNQPWGDQPLSDAGLLLLAGGMLLALIGANLLVFSSQLETEVRKDGVYYRYRPLINQWVQLSKDNINTYQIKRFHPLMDFGGWGYRMRFLFKNKRAFHIKGYMGLSLHLGNGKIILLGTQKPDRLRSAMKKMMEPPEEF